MSRILYYMFPRSAVQGGLKMIARHVETLRDLGFDALCRMGPNSQRPAWFDYNGSLPIEGPVEPDDVLVIPEDSAAALRSTLGAGNRTVILSQNPFSLGLNVGAAEEMQRVRPLQVLAVAPRLAATWRRLFPAAQAEIAPCFADERLFRPGTKRGHAVALSPRKRPKESLIIENLFVRLHPGRALEWRPVSDAHERVVAGAFAESTLHLALGRMESVGMTTLEAMACGCLCTGFLGVGGYEFATRANGLWVPDDDCESAVQALALADDIARTGGPALAERLEAGRATAEAWSYARFRPALEAAWMRLAPETRVKSGPLEPA